MIVRPRPGFEAPVRIADAINPFIVILSIVGLFLEYTPIKPYVVSANQVLDLVFVADFVLRLACHRPIQYFARGYGWVDFLASLPGIMLVFSFAQVFALFKFVRIGRFFKIVRVLRFLRVFNFLKRMKSESPWIQDRVMKIGVSIVLCFVCGIFLADSGLKAALESSREQTLRAALRGSAGDVGRLAAQAPGLLAVRKGELILDAAGSPLPGGQAAWDAALGSDLHWAIEVAFEGPAPFAILASADDLMARHDGIMLILLGTLVALLLIVVFYLGAVFAQDMSIAHLIIDSIEAEDLQLLEQEALRVGEGSLELQSGESEMESLLKAVARLGSGAAPGSGARTNAGADQSIQSEIPGLELGSLGLPGLAAARLGPGGATGGTAFDAAFGAEGPGDLPERLAERLESIEDRLTLLSSSLSGANKRLIVETIRIITPAIVRAVKKTLKDEAK